MTASRLIGAHNTLSFQFFAFSALIYSLLFVCREYSVITCCDCVLQLCQTHSVVLAKMDIFNRPPTISEDTVQYVLYPSAAQADKASATTLAVLMQNHAAALLPDMQWHRDAFQLKVVPHPRGAGCVLEGRMRVGDSIDDEWAAVWLLREITARWDAAVRCVCAPCDVACGC